MIRVARTSLMITAVIIALGLIGCGDDLYGECEIRPESGDILENCLSEGDDAQTVSCVVRDQGQCQTGTCGRYRGSTPFCTATCVDDDDCPAGECREFVYQSGERYCVAYDDI